MRANVLEFFWAEVAGENEIGGWWYLQFGHQKRELGLCSGEGKIHCVYRRWKRKLQCNLLGVYFYGLLLQVL